MWWNGFRSARTRVPLHSALCRSALLTLVALAVALYTYDAFEMIGNGMIEIVCKSESCMVSK